jgi:hypothetical protein
VSDEPSTCEAGGEKKNAKREKKNMKTIPVRCPQETKKKRKFRPN